MALIGIALGLAFLGWAFTFGLFLGVSFLTSYTGLMIITILLAVKLIKRTSLTLTDDQAGYQASSFDQGLIGMEGVVHRDLKPSGVVNVSGTLYQAMSEGGYIRRGEKIKVLSGRGNTIIVRG